jgi:sigma-B regulation protein RsbU (phosphoserine phosphatase)
MVTSDADHKTPHSRELTADVKYRLLLQIFGKIVGTLTLDDILNHLLDAVRLVSAYDAAGIFILSRTGLTPRRGPLADVIAGMALRGFDNRLPGSDPMLKSGKGIVGAVIRTGKSIVCPDVRRDRRYIKGRDQTLSEIAVPVFLSGQVIGALNLESDQVGTYSEVDVEMLQFFANAAAISIERAVLHRQLLQKKVLETQLEIAREVQASLLPKAPPQIPGYDIAGLNLPAYEIGGDYYDYIPFPNGHLGVPIADVSGKGIPAALIMATFRAALRTQVRNDFELPHIMQSINRLLVDWIGVSGFVTAVYGILDPAAGTYIYANCGHNLPVLMRADGGIEMLDRGGAALGVLAEAEYETAIVSLAPGDTLVLFTDGVVEAANADGEEFGPERLIEVLKRTSGSNAQKMVRAVVKETRAHARRHGYQDDFTIVVLRRQPPPQPGEL